MKTITSCSLAAAFVLSSGSLFAATAQENWDQLCAKCHAADGSGNTKIGKKLKVLDYTDPAVQAQFTDEHLAKVTLEGSVKNGKEVMKAFKDELSAEDVDALVAYIRQMKK